MKKSLLAKIASVGLGLSMVCGGSVKAAGNNEGARPISMRNIASTALSVWDVAHGGWINTSYLAQGKLGKFALSFIPGFSQIQCLYNTYQCITGQQTSADGTLL